MDKEALEQVFNKLEAVRPQAGSWSWKRRQALIDAILALQSSERGEEECIATPRKLFDFLMGTGEIDGTSFGELADGLPGRFWWRALLKTAEDQTLSPAEPSPESREGVVEECAKVAEEYRGPPPLRHAGTCRGIASAIRALSTPAHD